MPCPAVQLFRSTGFVIRLFLLFRQIESAGTKERNNLPERRCRNGDLYGYSKPVMLAAGISSLEKANIFFPRSFSDAPM